MCGSEPNKTYDISSSSTIMFNVEANKFKSITKEIKSNQSWWCEKFALNNAKNMKIIHVECKYTVIWNSAKAITNFLETKKYSSYTALRPHTVKSDRLLNESRSL